MPSQIVLPEAHDTEERLSSFGFRFGKTSIHTSRTLMFAELSTLLSVCSPDATKEDFYRAIIQDNLLGKTTVMARKLTAERLAGLYSLDVEVCVFRVMRHFWTIEEQGRPVLALLCALARDPLLRSSVERILSMHSGEQLICADMVTYLETQSPGRFSRVTFTSAAKNINSTWTQAGYLSGKVRKKRTPPTITPATVTYALLLAYLEGARAQRLFDSLWVRVDLTEKHAAGEPVDSKNINKHKNDVFRLIQIIDPELTLALPESIKSDVEEFIRKMEEGEAVDLKNLGVKVASLADVLTLLKKIYGVA